MAEIDAYKFRCVPSASLTAAQHAEINRVAYESVASDFPDRDPIEQRYLVEASALHRANPNRAIGGLHLRRGQAFARAVSVLAIAKSTDETGGPDTHCR